MTLGNAANAKVRLIVWCKACGHQVEPRPRRDGCELRRNVRSRSAGAAGLFSVREPAGRYGDRKSPLDRSGMDLETAKVFCFRGPPGISEGCVRTAMKARAMSILTEDMRRVVEEQRLGFVATVCPDGTPNLSAKGTTAISDDEHLVFADICSPTTVANIRQNPVVEINVVDTVSRKGYRFKGPATILGEGAQFEEGLAFYRKRGSTTAKRHVVLVKVERAAPLVSPVYDQGETESQVRTQWRRYWEKLWGKP